jgi:small ligand-binding sensory domain FIST
MSQFKMGHASADNWQVAAYQCLQQIGTVGQANLGFIYATDQFAGEMAEVLAYLKQETGVQHWVGSVAMGVCATGIEYFDKPAIVILLAEFPEDSFQVFSTIADDFSGFINKHQIWYQSRQALFAIVHGDPNNRHLPKLIVQLSEQIGDAFLVGGLTSSRNYYVQVANELVGGGLSGVLFSNEITVATRLTQGCSTIGTRHEITESDQNIIIKLDHRPALDVFKEDIGDILARDLNRVAGYIFAALPIQGSDTGDYLVRNLIGIDTENKLLAIGDYVEPGMSIMFARRDAQTAREDLEKMLKQLKVQLNGRIPRGGVYYSCLGRGENLFGKDSAELRLIQQQLGHFPLVGFFANGEISHHRLYGYTGVLTVFLS